MIITLAATRFRRLVMALLALPLLMAAPALADVSRFVGEFSGAADVLNVDGSVLPRDMSVEIEDDEPGFTVTWTSTTHKTDGRVKESTQSIDFVPSDQDGVFAAAMKRNVFGHAVQMDPMKGEPYVWARITGDTLTVFSLFVDTDGGYEMQQFDRTLAEGGLLLSFSRVRNGERLRSVETFLKRH